MRIAELQTAAEDDFQQAWGRVFAEAYASAADGIASSWLPSLQSAAASRAAGGGGARKHRCGTVHNAAAKVSHVPSGRSHHRSRRTSFCF